MNKIINQIQQTKTQNKKSLQSKKLQYHNYQINDTIEFMSTPAKYAITSITPEAINTSTSTKTQTLQHNTNYITRKY